MKTAAIISDADELAAFCRRLRDARRFAFDTEFIRDETYDAALCLVQVAVERDVVLIDPGSGIDVRAFWDLVADPGLTKIVHAGKEDFEVCLRATGAPPRNVFDVQIAAGLVGYGYPLSLTRLVAAVLGRRIAKGQTLTDWLRRPLTSEQVRYAVEDVKFLPAIHDKLRRRLQDRGRLEWAQEEFARFEDPITYGPPASERALKLKGTRRLDPLGLAVLERLVQWRDRWARERNRPTRALMRDDVLVEIARRRPRKASDLQVLRGFPQANNPRIIQQILTIIEETRKVPADELPDVPEVREESPMERAALDVLSAAARAACFEAGVSFDLLGSQQRLRELIDARDGAPRHRPALLTGWREQFVGRMLLDVLHGRRELHLSGWPRKPRLDVVARDGAG